MPTWTAFTSLKGKVPADALGEDLELLDPEPIGVGVFEIEDGSGLWEVGSYFTEKPDEVALALLAAAHGAGEFVISELPEADWVDKVRRDLKPVEAGRFFVYGSHDADKLPTDKVGLLIEASMAFGTGHHGTTQGCLIALDKLAQDGVEVGSAIDVGCGTAVLAMACTHLWPIKALASDIDEVAVDVARANVQVNGVSDKVTCIVAAGLDDPQIAAEAPFDLIVANILKAPLIALAPEFAGALVAGGHAVLSGLLNRQAEDVLAAYADAGFAEVRREVLGDWTTLTLIRRG